VVSTADELIVNKHETLLLIGKAAERYAIGEIVYAEDYDEVLNLYGDSDLSRAFRAAQNNGAKYIYLLNVEKDSDYFEVVESIKHGDFAYVAFVSLFLSDTFQDTYGERRIHSTLAYLLGSIGRDCLTTFVVTDKHASLYESIDDFLIDMTKIQNKFIHRCSVRANLKNIIFVANNLTDYPVASVPLAASLCSTPVNEYPTLRKPSKAIFYISSWDGMDSMAYYRTEPNGVTNVENLLNMCLRREPEKVVFVDRILKYIQRGLDFQEFKGKQHTEHRKLLFKEKLEKYLEGIKGFIIKHYRIDQINVVDDLPGTVIYSSRIRVLPINCFEICTIKKDVEV
jgi:hypothetical protein